MQLLLAHGLLPDGHGSLAMSILMLVGMTIPLIILGVVCWIFYRAKQREDEELRRASEWQNVRSS